MNGIISITSMKSITNIGERIMDENNKAPQGKFMATAKVGQKGQIVIPKGVRDLFDINTGDTLLVMADINQGIAIVKYDLFKQFADEILNAQGKVEEPEE